MGLVALPHVESFQTGDWTCIPCIGRHILNHWTTRGAPNLDLLKPLGWLVTLETQKLGLTFRTSPVIFRERLSWFWWGSGFPGGSDSKKSASNVGDPGSIPGSGRSPGEENSNPLQSSSLENSMDRGAWWVTVPGLDMTEHTQTRGWKACQLVKVH